MKPEEFIPALESGRTQMLTGFRSKAGNAFSAYLVFSAKAKKVSLAFEEKPPVTIVKQKFPKPNGDRKH